MLHGLVPRPVSATSTRVQAHLKSLTQRIQRVAIFCATLTTRITAEPTMTDLTQTLPPELLAEILGYASFRDILSVSQVRKPPATHMQWADQLNTDDPCRSITSFVTLSLHLH